MEGPKQVESCTHVRFTRTKVKKKVKSKEEILTLKSIAATISL